MNQYIGVTGFTKPEQILSALQSVPHGHRCKLMVGILVSAQSLRRIPMKNPKWAKRYPSPEHIEKLCLSDERVLNLVHYTGRGHPGSLVGDMVTIHQLAGRNLHGFQLNMAWPDVRHIDDYRLATRYESGLVLQLSKRAIEKVGDSAREALKRLYFYRHSIDAVLYDPSGGEGEAFDPVKAWEFIPTLVNAGWDVGLAGGIGPDSMRTVEPFAAKYPHLNIDMEGLVSTVDGDLNSVAVTTALTKAFAMFA